jgi:hypothetical protein
MWPTKIFSIGLAFVPKNLAHHWSTQFPICYTLSFEHMTVYSLSHLLYSPLLTKYKEDPPQTDVQLGSSVWGGSCGEIYSFHQYPPIAPRLP